MNAIEAILKIIDKCDLLLDGEVFSKEFLMQAFAKFLSATIEKEKHNVGFVLHTGSVCFDALALAYSAVTCLVYNDANVDDVIMNSLKLEDVVLYGDKKKERYIFKGLTTFPSKSEEYIHLWTNDSDSTYVPRSRWRYIIPYYGSSKSMDGRGLRIKDNVREKVYSEILGYSFEKIPSVLNVSVVIVMPKDRISNLIEKLSIRFGDTEVKLTDLVTISYFTENDEFIIGGNAARTEPIIKVASKMSVVRRLILPQNGNKHIGLVVFGNES